MSRCHWAWVVLVTTIFSAPLAAQDPQSAGAIRGAGPPVDERGTDPSFGVGPPGSAYRPAQAAPDRRDGEMWRARPRRWPRAPMPYSGWYADGPADIHGGRWIYVLPAPRYAGADYGHHYWRSARRWTSGRDARQRYDRGAFPPPSMGDPYRGTRYGYDPYDRFPYTIGQRREF